MYYSECMDVMLNARYTDDELYHYGVRGMKWGVRRARKALKKMPKHEKRAENLDYLSKKYEYKSVSARTSRGRQRWHDESVKASFTAQKLRHKDAKALRRIKKLNAKISTISKADLNDGYSFCKDFQKEFKATKYKDIVDKFE